MVVDLVRHGAELDQLDPARYELAPVHGRQTLPGGVVNEESTHTEHIADPVGGFHPCREPLPLPDAPGLTVQPANPVEPETMGKLVEFAHLGQVLHEVRDAVLCLLGVRGAMGPESQRPLAFDPSSSIPMGHPDAVRKPCDEVVMDATPSGQFSDPYVPGFNPTTLAPGTVTVHGLGDVVRLPHILLPVCEGDKPWLIGPMAGVLHPMELAGKPDGRFEVFEPFELPCSLVEADGNDVPFPMRNRT